MAVISVLVAASVAWAFGALWYGLMGTRWMDAARLSEAEVDRGNPVPHVVGYVALILVAAMTRHILASSGVTTAGAAMLSGLGLGLFVAAPFVAINVLYAQRSADLIWIDGAYPAVGTALIGLVLGWFL